jgi:DegV family protein with EDD domain
MHYIISTDTTADLSKEYVEKYNLPLLSFNYIVNGTTHDITNELPYKEFYNKMREGAVPKTSQVNPQEAKEFFQKVLNESDADILHVAFSSGLSGSFNSTFIAARELMEENPGRKIIVVDTLGASLGQGLLVNHAIKLREQGKSIDEVSKWLEDNKLSLCHLFTVEDLIYLYRGGRVSRTKQAAAGVLNIKPVLHVDNDGHLVPMVNARGRNKSLKQMVDIMEERRFEGDQDVFVSHGDSIEDAQHVADMIKERFGIEVAMINHIGPTIGTHSGPGTIALFFLGSVR